nr:hypothetical protein [uncultured Psychroserpens sp.]
MHKTINNTQALSEENLIEFISLKKAVMNIPAKSNKLHCRVEI